MKNISITVYVNASTGEKFHSDNMTLTEAQAWVKKWMKKNDVWMAWDFEANEDITYNFLTR